MQENLTRRIERLREKAELADERHKKMLSAVVEFPSEERLPNAVLDQWAAIDRSNPNKKNVLVLYYGGTLGMHYEDRGNERVLVPTNNAFELLTPLRAKGLEDRMNVVWFPVLGKAIDSTNGRWPHWVSIANAIELLYDKYDGFVIAGGTDTMAYLMAAMHFIFPNMGKPIIGAGAQLPMADWGEDATQNLAFSLEAACTDISGAHLAFNNVLRDGRHIFKIKDRDFDAFDCPPQYITGHFSQGEVLLHGIYRKRDLSITKDRLRVNKSFRDGIDKVELHPFDYADSLLHTADDPNHHAILLITYGAGNVRNVAMYDGERTHVDIIRELHARRFPVVLGSPMQDGVVNSPYEAGAEAIIAGAISGGDTTGAALLVKMSRVLYNSWWTEKKRAEEIGKKNEYPPILYGPDYLTFRSEMYRSHVGELAIKMKDLKL